MAQSSKEILFPGDAIRRKNKNFGLWEIYVLSIGSMFLANCK